MSQLNGKTVIVTGGNRGIGRAIAARLAVSPEGRLLHGSLIGMDGGSAKAL